MELKEKLDGFYRAAMGAAEEQSHTMLDKYRKEYEGKIAVSAGKGAGAADEGDGRKGACAQGGVNRRLSEEMLRAKKRSIIACRRRRRQSFLRWQKKSFPISVRQRRIGELLAKRIQKAIAFAQGEALRIYIDPADEGFRQELEKRMRL